MMKIVEHIYESTSQTNKLTNRGQGEAGGVVDGGLQGDAEDAPSGRAEQTLEQLGTNHFPSFSIVHEPSC